MLIAPYRPFMRLLVPVLSMMMVGCSDASSPNESELYRDDVRIAGFELVKKDYAQGAYAIFVGPREVDLISATMAPGLTLEKGSVDLSPGPNIEYVADGRGKLPNGVECYVVLDVHRGNNVIEYIGSDYLADDQRSGIEDGSLVVVEVGVVCGPQADR